MPSRYLANSDTRATPGLPERRKDHAEHGDMCYGGTSSHRSLTSAYSAIRAALVQEPNHIL